MPEATVVDLDSYRATSTPNRQHVLINAMAEVDSTTEREDGRRETRMEDLYPQDAEADALIQRVRTMLRGAAKYALDAKEAMTAGDTIGADQKTMLLQGTLPELFCCREVSEGMATFVLGLFHGLNNQHGKPLNLDQIFLISKALSFISDRPFLSFAESIDFLAGLEQEGIDIDPAEASELNTLLIEDDAQSVS